MILNKYYDKTRKQWCWQRTKYNKASEGYLKKKQPEILSSLFLFSDAFLLFYYPLMPLNWFPVN
jgi:hypothetical protein